MIRKFLTLDDMKDFAKWLGGELKRINAIELSNEILEFQSNYYTTSSEYLGEFRKILKKVLKEKDDSISNNFKVNIIIAIDEIDKSFGN